jgi:hypothetical protein
MFVENSIEIRTIVQENMFFKKHIKPIYLQEIIEQCTKQFVLTVPNNKKVQNKFSKQLAYSILFRSVTLTNIYVILF